MPLSLIFQTFIGKYCVKLNGKYGIVDKDDKVVIPYMYDSELYKVRDDKFVVNKDNKYGIIDFKNQLVFGMIPHPILTYDDYIQVMDISRIMGAFQLTGEPELVFGVVLGRGV